MDSAGPCPRCGDPSWFQKDGDDVIQRCVCGLHKIVYTRNSDGITIVRRIPPNRVILPKSGTKIAKCLSVVSQKYPDMASTMKVSEETGFSRDETASHLMMLMNRGLVDRVRNRRGMAGGSMWKLTTRSEQLLNFRRKR